MRRPPGDNVDTQNAPTQDPTPQDLSPEAGASLFAALLDAPEEPERKEPEAQTQEPPEVEAEPEPSEEQEELVTVKIDGKEVQVPISELKNGYQRQADYTKKTMEAAEQRKAAEQQIQQAQQERANYAQNLQRMQSVLEAALQQQQQTNWEELLQSDPVEYLRQQHLAQQRQAALQQNLAEQQKVRSQFEAEQAQMRQNYLAEQHRSLIDKLPAWKDEAKAKAEKAQIRDYLLEQGFTDSDVSQVADARAVLMARKAMLYDQMVAKASAAAKKVSTLPQRVEKPGTEPASLDRRNSAYQRLSKSGRVEDAAAAFASLL